MEDVESGTGHLAGLERVREGFVDDELAAGAVHDADAGLHDGDGLPVDEALGLPGEADVEGEEVGPAEKVVDLDQGDAVLAGDDRGDKGVVADEGHVEGAGAASYLEADAAEADDAEGLAAEFGALERLLVPLAGVHAAVGLRNFATHRDHKAEGEFGDGDGVGAGGVHDDNALAGGSGGVDVIHADAGAADEAEGGSVLEERGVDLDGGANDQGVGVAQLLGEGAFDLIGGDDLPAGLLLEHREGGGGDFFGENNLHVSLDLICDGSWFTQDRPGRSGWLHACAAVRSRYPPLPPHCIC